MSPNGGTKQQHVMKHNKGVDNEKLAYFGTNSEMLCDDLACHLQALVTHYIQAIVCWLRK